MTAGDALEFKLMDQHIRQIATRPFKPTPKMPTITDLLRVITHQGKQIAALEKALAQHRQETTEHYHALAIRVDNLVDEPRPTTTPVYLH